MVDDLRKSLPLHVLNLKESFKSMRKSEADLFPTRLPTASLHSLNTCPALDAAPTALAPLAHTPRVILISSKVPCCHALLESLRLDTLAIPYDFEATDLGTLSHMLARCLRGRLAKSIGMIKQ